MFPAFASERHKVDRRIPDVRRRLLAFRSRELQKCCARTWLQLGAGSVVALEPAELQTTSLSRPSTTITPAMAGSSTPRYASSGPSAPRFPLASVVLHIRDGRQGCRRAMLLAFRSRELQKCCARTCRKEPSASRSTWWRGLPSAGFLALRLLAFRSRELQKCCARTCRQDGFSVVARPGLSRLCRSTWWRGPQLQRAVW